LMDRKQLVNGETPIPTIQQGYEANTWDSSFMKPALESLENANMPMRGQMANLNPMAMKVQTLDMWRDVGRGSKPRATLVPKPLKAHMPKPLPSAESPVNMLEGIPYTPEQLAIMGRRFGPTAREMGMADIADTPKSFPLKAEIPTIAKQFEKVIRKEPELSNLIANTPKISTGGLPPEAIVGMAKINAFRKMKGIEPLTAGDMKSVKDYFKTKGKEKINAFRASKGLPPI
jgi:hypothetical protein